MTEKKPTQPTPPELKAGDRVLVEGVVASLDSLTATLSDEHVAVRFFYTLREGRLASGANRLVRTCDVHPMSAAPKVSQLQALVDALDVETAYLSASEGMTRHAVALTDILSQAQAILDDVKSNKPHREWVEWVPEDKDAADTPIERHGVHPRAVVMVKLKEHSEPQGNFVGPVLEWEWNCFDNHRHEIAAYKVVWSPEDEPGYKPEDAEQ